MGGKPSVEAELEMLQYESFSYFWKTARMSML